MAESSFYGLLVLASHHSRPSDVLPEFLPELHLNLWEKKEKWIFESAFLDIGLMLDISETAQTFEFFLPWLISESDIEDLSSRLREKGAIPAIFNEGWTCSFPKGGSGYVTNPANGEIFTFINLVNDITVKACSQSSTQQLQAISLNVPSIIEKSRSTANAAKKVYIRFRIKNVPKKFYRANINPRDRLFLSSWQRTEIIDFRMNVRRGVPLDFEQQAKADFVSFRKVHLFLMKSRDQDIVFEDKIFKSCRSLEDEDFWAHYSLKSSPNDLQKYFSHRRVKNSLGYQWTKIAVDKEGFSEFGILAKFKNVRFGLLRFIIIAGFVGVFGNMIWDALQYRYYNSSIGITARDWLAQKSELEIKK